MLRLIKKAFRDLLIDKRRAFLSFLAIFIGIFAFGVILFSYQIINREITNEFNGINPSSAIIQIDNVDENLLELTSQYQDIDYYEERAIYTMRIKTGENEWKSIELFAVENFDSISLNKITSEDGSFQPANDEILLERDALSVANATIGDTIIISDSFNQTWSYNIVGTVADISQHPASMHNTVYGYITFEALDKMGFTPNQIVYTVSEAPYNRQHILSVSSDYIKLLEDYGYTTTKLDVSQTPGVSIHYEEYSSTLFLLQIFSIIMFLFGCVIISNLVTSILSSQIRQIGILKAIGSDTKKIIVSYLFAFSIIILCIVTISIPVTTYSARYFSIMTMSLSNMIPSNLSISWYLYFIYFVFSLILPIIIAYFPIRRAINLSVKEAITNAGITNDTTYHFPNLKLSRPVVLSIHNALRKKQRFIINLALLSIGGSIFVTVFTTMLATNLTINNNLASLKYDYQILTNTTSQDINDTMSEIPYVNNYEIWGVSTAQLVNETDEIANSYTICAPHSSSEMIDPTIIEGRWLNEDDTNAIVVSHKFLTLEGEYAIGSTIELIIGDSHQEFILVGIIKDLGETTIYMNESSFYNYVDVSSQFSSLKLDLEFSKRPRVIYSAIEDSLIEHSISILSSESISDIADTLAGHYTVTLQTFTFIIFMLVIVSGFNLAATMNAQTSERTKEIGIMKAIGANQKQIFRIITMESIFISLLSWCISIILGIPFSFIGIYVFGEMIIKTPLDLSVPSFLIAFLIWLLLTLLIGYFASRQTAKRAAKMNISTALTFDI